MTSEVSQLSQSQPDDYFPVWVLPERVQSFVLEAADALGVDWSMVAGPCLAALAGSIGNRRRIVVKPDAWSEACVLWVAIVVPSGGRKTPSIGLVLEHLQEREAAEVKAATARRTEYEERLREWKAEKVKGKESPEKPEPARRLLVSDITTEGLLAVHAGAPLGLLLHRDELAGLIRGFDQYKGGKGGDAQTWTEMYQGRPCLIDRKGSGTLSVPRAAVSIIGGVQPELLQDVLSGEHLYNGVASRFLFVAPPESPKVWNEETVSAETREGWNGLLDELLALQPNEDGTPVDLPMTPQAKEAWVRYYNEHAQREAEEDGPLRSAMSKLEGTVPRLALIIQLATDPHSAEVGIEAIQAGIAISHWFEGQARRVYQGFGETDQERDRREACGWIANREGKTTRRDFARFGPGRFRKRADKVLADLVSAGLAKVSPKSGHRAEEYVLCDCDTCDSGTQ